jgi:hypothetical protein
MLFKCGTCTYIVDSNIHGKGPCPMCNEWRPRRLALERGDPGYEAPGGVEGKAVEAGEVGGKVSDAHVASKKKDDFTTVLDVVESRGFALDPNLVGSAVEVVGTTESQRGRSCPKHSCCGSALIRVGSHVCFRKTRFAWRDGEEEDVLEAYFIEDGLATCKVGYLPKHLAFRADRYDGLCARILEVYSSDKAETDCVAKRQKYHRKCGCCVAVIVGMKDMFAIK